MSDTIARYCTDNGFGFAPTRLLVLQATPFCNIDCRYCYLPHRNDRQRLSLDRLDMILKNFFRLFRASSDMTVCWHSGEPLVLGPSYYESSIALFDQYITADIRPKYAFQTNGMLISDDFCRLFRAHNVSVGVSMDGPSDVHDRWRVDRHGNGTHAAVLAGIRRLQEWNIPFHIIMVITADALRQPERLVDFLEENEISSVALNIEEIEGPHNWSSVHDKHYHQSVVRFFCEFFAAASKTRTLKSIRELNSGIARIRNQFAGRSAAYYSNEQVHPGSIVSVDARGDWSTYSPELLGWEIDGKKTFNFGNLAIDRLDTPFSVEGERQLRRLTIEIARGVARCRETCPYFGVCGGGAPSNKFFENGSFDSTKTLYCGATQQALFDSLIEIIGGDDASIEAQIGDVESVSSLARMHMPSDAANLERG